MNFTMHNGAVAPEKVTPTNDNARLQPSVIEQQATGNSQDCRRLQADEQDLRPIRLTPRHRRVLQALLSGPQAREALDRIAGASDAPDEIRHQRQLGQRHNAAHSHSGE